MASKIKNIGLASVHILDQALARLYLSLFHENSSLIILLFHRFFENTKELESGHNYPMERLYVTDFRTIVNYFLEHDYTFLTTEALGCLSNNPGKYLLLTFDDGYLRSSNALPVLKEYNVPAIFFISTNHVQQGKCFWWDVLYRERYRRGSSDSQISQEIQHLKQWTNDAIEDYLTGNFGATVLQPLGDSDRPLTPTELRALASEPLVSIGNHTCDHAVLTNYPMDQVCTQIVGAQEALMTMIGLRPTVISYPNGNYSAEVIRIAQGNGLRIGITSAPYKNRLPLQTDGAQAMRLGRFTFLPGKDVRQQCELFRADISLYRLWRNRSFHI